MFTRVALTYQLTVYFLWTLASKSTKDTPVGISRGQNMNMLCSYSKLIKIPFVLFQKSAQFMRHAKRRRLNTEDFNKACRFSDIQVNTITVQCHYCNSRVSLVHVFVISKHWMGRQTVSTNYIKLLLNFSRNFDQTFT